MLQSFHPFGIFEAWRDGTIVQLQVLQNNSTAETLTLFFTCIPICSVMKVPNWYAVQGSDTTMMPIAASLVGQQYYYSALGFPATIFPLLRATTGAAIKFANNRYAPATPAGSSLKNTRPVYTNFPLP